MTDNNSIQLSQQEKEKLIELKQKELELHEREIAASEAKNKRTLTVVIFLFFLLIGIIIVVAMIILKEDNIAKSNAQTVEQLSLQATNAFLSLQLTNAAKVAIPTQIPTEMPILVPTNIIVSPQPIQPTSTLAPSLTPIQDTQPGFVLEIGQTWKQSGLELTLDEAKLDLDWGKSDSGIIIRLLLTNTKLNDITLKYNVGRNISAVDNRGQSLPVDVTGCSQFYYEPEDFLELLKSGETIVLRSKPQCSEKQSAFILVDASNIAITDVIIKISISQILDARWRIPILH